MAARRRSTATSAGTRPRVAIVGANFAGLRAAQRLGPRFDVTVFDPSDYVEWLPNIHELISGLKRPADLRLSRRRLLARAGHRYVCAAVTTIDGQRGRLTTGRAEYEFDYCIVAIGGHNETYGVPGADRYALPFKTVAQCDAIRRRLQDVARGRTPRSVVIVGGGFEGIEALGEVLRGYGEDRQLTVHLIEAGDRLMPRASPKIDASVRRHCAGRNVRIHVGSPVARVTRGAVRLRSGERVRSDLTIWTGGVVAPPLLHQARLAPKPRQWATVDATLRSRRYPKIFVAGDAAGLATPVAKQAFHALEMGDCAADNVMRAASGRALRVFRPSRTPLLVAFGNLDTFLVAGRSVVANPALASGKEAVFQLTMAQLDPPTSAQGIVQLASRVAGVSRRFARPDTRGRRLG